MSEALRGTSQSPTAMAGKLAASRDRDLLPEWRKQKDEAYQAGMAVGAGLVATVIKADWKDPYLQYLYLLGVGQAIANHGRDLVGVENIAAKANDTEGKNR